MSIISNRVAKSSKRNSTQHRKDLARDISFFSIDILPYSYCKANDLKDYRALDCSTKYNNCLGLGRSNYNIYSLIYTLSASFRR